MDGDQIVNTSLRQLISNVKLELNIRHNYGSMSAILTQLALSQLLTTKAQRAQRVYFFKNREKPIFENLSDRATH
ncbi:MAG: hypothetical protein DRG71_02270 [Deltaproteobacteria bacterium]|nr:MAG: hypothetical protein DRG71_02270 [Deltaproteobacteria bacterium]